MSDTRYLTDICFDRIVDFVFSQSEVIVLGDGKMFFEGLHQILSAGMETAVSRQREVLLALVRKPTVN